MFLQWAVPGSLIPLYSLRLERQLLFEPRITGFCCATQAAAGVISSLLAGQIADRWMSAEKIMSLCATLAGLDLFLLAELREPTSVFFATLFFWVVTGPMLLYGTTISFAHLPEPGRQFGPIRMWGTIGWMGIGYAISFYSGDALHVGGAVALLLAVYALTLPATPPRRPDSNEPNVRFAPLKALGLMRKRSFAIYAVCMLGACITFPFTTQNNSLLLETLGVEKRWLTSVLTIAQATEVIGLALLPTILLTFGVRWTMAIGLASWLAAMCILSIGEPLELVLGSMALNGLYVVGFLIAGQVYVNSLAEGDIRASVQGLLACIGGIGTLLGNVLVGWLRQFNHGALPPTFAVAAGITGGILLLFMLGFHQPRRPLE